MVIVPLHVVVHTETIYKQLLLLWFGQYLQVLNHVVKEGKTSFTNVCNNLHHEDSFWLWAVEDNLHASTECQRGLA